MARLLTETRIESRRIRQIVRTAEQKGGEVTVFSSEFPPGQQLSNLGGIAALLRYRLE